MRAKVLMLGAMKGGVGKSVSSFNLAYSLQKLGKKVLAVDFDSQANLSTCFGVEEPATVPVTIGHLLMAQLEEEELPDAAEYIRSRKGVDFIPSSMMLSAVDAKLRLEMGAERMLASVLEPLRERYDYIIIDTCPSLGALTINALAAADEVIITVNPQLLAMMGLQDFLKTVRKIKNRINSGLKAAGILLTMCEERTNLCKTITEQITDVVMGKDIVLIYAIFTHDVSEKGYLKFKEKWNNTIKESGLDIRCEVYLLDLNNYVYFADEMEKLLNQI